MIAEMIGRGRGRKWQKVLTAVRFEPNEPPRLRWLIKLSNYGNQTLLYDFERGGRGWKKGNRTMKSTRPIFHCYAGEFLGADFRRLG